MPRRLTLVHHKALSRPTYMRVTCVDLPKWEKALKFSANTVSHLQNEVNIRVIHNRRRSRDMTILWHPKCSLVHIRKEHDVGAWESLFEVSKTILENRTPMKCSKYYLWNDMKNSGDNWSRLRELICLFDFASLQNYSRINYCILAKCWFLWYFALIPHHA